MSFCRLLVVFEEFNVVLLYFNRFVVFFLTAFCSPFVVFLPFISCFTSSLYCHFILFCLFFLQSFCTILVILVIFFVAILLFFDVFFHHFVVFWTCFDRHVFGLLSFSTFCCFFVVFLSSFQRLFCFFFVHSIVFCAFLPYFCHTLIEFLSSFQRRVVLVLSPFYRLFTGFQLSVKILQKTAER